MKVLPPVILKELSMKHSVTVQLYSISSEMTGSFISKFKWMLLNGNCHSELFRYAEELASTIVEMRNHMGNEIMPLSKFHAFSRQDHGI